VAGGRWASSKVGEEGRGAAMELRSAIMPPLGPIAKVVAMASWLRHQCARADGGCASLGAGDGGWTSPNAGGGADGCLSSSPSSGG
jgi:hypothetical protein